MEITQVKPNIFFLCKEERKFRKKSKSRVGKKIKKVSNIGLRYLQGIETLDESGYFKNDNPMFIYRHNNGVVLKLFNVLQKLGYIFSVSDEEVKSITFIDGKEIEKIKSKSVIGRGIAGALIAGPVGAIVGGMSGIGDKVQKVKEEAYMTIETTDDIKITFKMMGEAKNYFEAQFKKIFKDKVTTITMME